MLQKTNLDNHIDFLRINGNPVPEELLDTNFISFKDYVQMTLKQQKLYNSNLYYYKFSTNAILRINKKRWFGSWFMSNAKNPHYIFCVCYVDGSALWRISYVKKNEIDKIDNQLKLEL